MDDNLSPEERRRRLRDQPVLGIEQRDGAVVVRLGGELDLYNAAVVRQALLDVAKGAPQRLVLDLAEVEFIDSTALGALVETRASLPDSRSLLLAAPAYETRRALQVSGLDRHLPVHETVDAALAAAL
jgi:anti-sigma B factor antagonist